MSVGFFKLGPMKWVLQEEQDSIKVATVQQVLASGELFPRPLANHLVARGLETKASLVTFFRPALSALHDPMRMKDMDKAVVRIMNAIEKGEKILVYGDYDVDGTTAVSLLVLAFTDWGIDFDYYIPDRYTEGYGISYKGVTYAEEVGASLIIALDCGTKAIDKIKFAQTKGIDFIVCDHHRPGPELPPVVALLNPKQDGCAYPYKELTGCGIGFKLLTALQDALAGSGSLDSPMEAYEVFERYGDLVALSTACDIVDVTGENRILLYHGLRKIRSHPLPGLRALMNLTDNPRTWNVSDLLFFLGPRINSAGRLGSARQAVDLLIGKDAHIAEQANGLHSSNIERQLLEKEITREALMMIDEEEAAGPGRNATVLFSDQWHKGVIGIVASRLIETYYRPTILLTRSDQGWVGSGRSVKGFDLYEAIDHCSEYVSQFGGHKYAAGLTIKEENIESFKEKFEEEVSKRITPDQKEETLFIASQIEFSYINPKFIRLIKQLAPFGPGNREPVFASRGVQVRESRILKEVHVRLSLAQNGVTFEAIGFGMADKWNKIRGSKIDLAFQPDFKTWNEKTYIQLKIKDIKESNQSVS